MRSPTRKSVFFTPPKRHFVSSKTAGLTLVEVMISVLILAMVTLGVLSTLLSTRQMTDFARKQMLVDTAVQGVLEQLKNRTSAELLADPTPACLASMSAMNSYLTGGGTAIKIGVELDNDPTDALNQLILSPGTPFAPPAGAVPVDTDNNGFGDVTGDGADDVGVNLLKLDTRNTNGLNGTTNSAGDDINIYLMIWVNDASQRAAPLFVTSRQITIYYTWTYKEGRVTKKTVDSVRAVCTPL